MDMVRNTLLKAADPASTGGTSGTSGSTGAGSSSAAAAKDASDRFLTLLVAQLQNQDPLNPLDNAQVTTQLAQNSTVSGISQLNDTVAALALPAPVVAPDVPDGPPVDVGSAALRIVLRTMSIGVLLAFRVSCRA